MEKLQHKKGSAALYISLLIVVVLSMIMLRQCSSKGLAPRHETISQGDTINVAIEISPMGVIMTGDTLGGVYYDMVRQLCNSHGRQVTFHPFTRLETALQGLDDGRYQIVVSDIPATAEMKKRYIFVKPVGIDRQVLVQHRDSAGNVAISNQFDLAKQEITVPAGSPFIYRLHNLASEIGDTIYIKEDPEYSSEQLIILTALGEIPNVVVSAGIAASMLKIYPQLDASLEISFNQFQGWAMLPRDSVLFKTINSWIEESNEH